MPEQLLHRQPDFISQIIRQKLISAGINFTAVTLHVGAGTFLPVKTENIHEHKMHTE